MSNHTSSSPAMPRIGVVIPHYRAPEALAQTLSAVQAQQGVQVEVFVRDNSDDNVLFTRAVNEGLAKFCFDDAYAYVLVLNHDAVLQPGCLAALAAAMAQHPEAGICAPIQVSASGQVTWCGSAQAFPFGVHGRSDGRPQAAFETYWANGACMLLRCRMVREIGLLDKNMRFICSDADYSFTARARGWAVMAVPDARVEHSLRSSGSDAPDWLNRVKYEDNLYFARKWLNGELYRSLAQEGWLLTPEVVRERVARVQAGLQASRGEAVMPAAG